MKTFFHVLVSIVLGFVLMIPLGLLFDAMNWPLFHTWGLAHGSFVLAWPALAIISALAIMICRKMWGRKG
ncbi:MAG: hypothetical protein ABR865_06715 [Terracidiphilus sp.]|jgi:hypothetical protein